MTISVKSFAEIKTLKLKEYPCDIKRNDKTPLSARKCVDGGNGSVIVTTCLNTMCLADKKSVNIKSITSCDDKSPTTPGFVFKQDLVKNVDSFLLGKTSSKQAKTIALDSLERVPNDLEKGIVYYNLDNSGHFSMEEVSQKLSRHLNSKKTESPTRGNDSSNLTESRAVAVFASNNIQAPLVFTTSSQGRWVQTSTIAALEKCE